MRNCAHEKKKHSLHSTSAHKSLMETLMKTFSEALAFGYFCDYKKGGRVYFSSVSWAAFIFMDCCTAHYLNYLLVTAV